jgi:putative FmdB family regulatory protein
MPIYEYRCGGCGHGFELRQGFNDPAEANCPQCRGASQRIIQPVGIVFKGSGWHITDYRRASSAALDPAGSKGDTPAAAEPAKSEAPVATPAPASSPSASSE